MRPGVSASILAPGVMAELGVRLTGPRTVSTGAGCELVGHEPYAPAQAETVGGIRFAECAR